MAPAQLLREHATGGEYDPATNPGSPTAMLVRPSARFAPTGVWTGSEMIVWGGVTEKQHLYEPWRRARHPGRGGR